VNKETIFITIPAYEDPSLLSTIEGALENALYPDRLFFCIGMQYSEDTMPDVSKYIDNPNFNFIFYEVDKRPGVYWIRREMAEKHSDQDYFLMIDSHMLFAKYWDAILINDYNDLKRLHGDRVIISKPAIPDPGETISNNLINQQSFWEVEWGNDNRSIERTFIPGSKQVPWNGDRYLRTLYSCSHFFFTNKNYLSDVGFHKVIRSYSEEYTIAVTSFLSGWDYYLLPEFIHIGHNDAPTSNAIYGKDNYSLADGKRYQALFETDAEKLEIEKFVLLDNSDIFKVRNQRRSIEEFYDFADIELQESRKKFIDIFELG
jgi:hypothetical protein